MSILQLVGMAKRYSDSVGVQPIVRTMVLALLAAAVVDLLIVPSEMFTGDEESQPIADVESSVIKPEPAGKLAPLSSLTLREAVVSPYFLVLFLYSIATMFQKAHYVNNVRETRPIDIAKREI
eukprot:GHVU01206092.1.p1 GENE.GHVU01206092.1~~GHVU01206092.1.p1  ORF type:complete len:123 (+),score=11.37 GHVU01206092.1:1546-1914(+)